MPVFDERKILDYDIKSNATLATLIAEVVAAIKEGWEPYGPCTEVISKYTQTMVKRTRPPRAP